MFAENGSGSVVNVASISTDQPPPNWSSYVTAKSALIGLTKALAVEFGPKKVRFNVVSPGMTETAQIGDFPLKARLLLAMQTPLRSLGQPSQVASSVEFLLSDRSSHITGEILRVCGGAVTL